MRGLKVRCDDGPKGWDTFSCEVSSDNWTTRRYSVVYRPDMNDYETEVAAHAADKDDTGATAAIGADRPVGPQAPPPPTQAPPPPSDSEVLHFLPAD